MTTIEIKPTTRRDAISDLSEDHQEVYRAIQTAGADMHAGHVGNETTVSVDSIYDRMKELEEMGHLERTDGLGYMDANGPDDVLTHHVVIRK